MKLIKIILLFALQIIIVHGKSKIMNGQNAKEGQFPYQAIITNGLGFCGGSIIHKRWILTAAHCDMGSDKNQRILVIVGSIKNFGMNGSYYVSRTFIAHEDFYMDDTYILNDIALLRLNKNLKFNKNVRPVKLPKIDLKDSNNSLVNISGWGIIHPNPPHYDAFPDILQYITVPVVSNNECHDVWNNTDDTHLCTSIHSGKSTCIGDSGGPVVSNNIQYGLVSYGDGLCGKDMPNVHTRVFPYLNWIKNQMKRYRDTLNY